MYKQRKGLVCNQLASNDEWNRLFCGFAIPCIVKFNLYPSQTWITHSDTSAIQHLFPVTLTKSWISCWTHYQAQLSHAWKTWDAVIVLEPKYCQRLASLVLHFTLPHFTKIPSSFRCDIIWWWWSGDLMQLPVSLVLATLYYTRTACYHYTVTL